MPLLRDFAALAAAIAASIGLPLGAEFIRFLIQ
jgi:hypothetical protein